MSADQSVDARISAVIAARRKLLPAVEQEIADWKRVDGLVVGLELAVDELRRYPSTPPDVAEALAALPIGPARAAIDSTVHTLSHVKVRIARETVNIGVSGQARVGKSTLLQSIAGLGEEHVPTGSGIPVTAVRSRIFHSPRNRRAILELHSYDTFRDDVLEAYHKVLRLRRAPRTVDEFRDWPYPAAGELAAAGVDVPHEHQTILRRLRAMRAALWSYEDLLARADRTLELTGNAFDELRSYVAYPTNVEEESGERVARRYLAVRDIRIECAFRAAQVENLGVIDLPGLGELAAGAEEHHVAGLRNEVDVVLLVKRAVEGMAYWGTSDGNTVRLVDIARGFIAQRRDFAFIVINTGTEDLIATLRDEIRRNANDGRDSLNFHVLETDATNPDAVGRDVLVPVLEHLVTRLPAMDAEIWDGTRVQVASCRALLARLAEQSSAAISAVRDLAAVSNEDLDDRTRELRKSLAESLGEYLDVLRDQAANPGDGFLSALDKVHQDTLGWIKSGFGVGKERWCRDAALTTRVDKSSRKFTVDQMNHIRVEIANRFTGLDIYLKSLVEDMWRTVAAHLARDLGSLLAPLGAAALEAHGPNSDGEADGEAQLRGFAARLAEASPPCSELRHAVMQLLGVPLDYHTHLRPRVRSKLDGLDPRSKRTSDGPGSDPLVASDDEQDPQALFEHLSKLAEEAASSTRKALAKHALLPAEVIYAAVDAFDDQLIRGPVSKRELTRLTRHYRDDIWPTVYRDIEETNARVARVAKATGDLSHAVARLGETSADLRA